MFLISHLRHFRYITVVFNVCLITLLPMQSQASSENEVNTDTAAQQYSGRPAEKIYNTYCIACHMSGLARAPRLGHAEEWQPRVAKGLDTLLANAIKGFNAMPPRGICSNCSDEEMLQTIQYMIDQSQ